MDEIKMIHVEDLFNEYDKIVNIVMINLYSLSKEKGKIILSELDKNNKDHLLILRVALMAKDIFNFPLSLNVSWWDSLIINWRARKLTHKIPRTKKTEGCVSVKALLEYMYPSVKHELGENFKFAHIYNSFYRKELD